MKTKAFKTPGYRIYKKLLEGRWWDPAVHGTACPLCLREFQIGKHNRRPVWDHCHECGGEKGTPASFRGFVCDICNVALPQRGRRVAQQGVQRLVRDPEWQKRAQIYLNAHLCQTDPIWGSICPQKAQNG